MLIVSATDGLTLRTQSYNTVRLTLTSPEAFNCSTQESKNETAILIMSNNGLVAGFSSTNHLLNVCSNIHPASPRCVKPTIRPEPFKVWNERRNVVNDSVSLLLFSKIGKVFLISARISVLSSK